MANEVAACFDISFMKARAKNVVEGNILCKQLKNLDRQYRRSVSSIESDIREERRFATRLKVESKEYRAKNLVEKDKTDVKIETIERHRKTALAKPKKSLWNISERMNSEDDEMSVLGQGMVKKKPCQPKMFFWSQDSSTNLPVMTSFYGYKLNVQNSITEAKLLGQQMYPELCESPSTETVATVGTSDLQNTKTSGAPGIKMFVEVSSEAAKRFPLPTREDTSVGEKRTTGDMKMSRNSIVGETKSKESELKKKEKMYNESKTKDLGKVYAWDTPVSRANHSGRTHAWEEMPGTREKELSKLYARDISSVNDSRSRTFPNLQDIRTEKSSPENINLDLRSPDSKQPLPQLLQRTAGTATGSARPPYRKVAMLHVRSKRGKEATKHYQSVIYNQTKEQPNVIAEVEQSYSEVPTLMNEIKRLQTTIEFLPQGKPSRYSNSAFGLSMQSVISKKVLNNSLLPVAFRKINNTMLRHYATPFMAVGAVKISSKLLHAE